MGSFENFHPTMRRCDSKGTLTPHFPTSSLWQRGDTNMTENDLSLTSGKLEVVCTLVWPTDIGRANNEGCD